MSNFNKVFLMGNLTRDIELRYTPANLAVADFSIASNRRFKGGDGESQEETTFVDCNAFGQKAEVMSQHLRKGRKVLVEGRLKLDQWEDKNTGQKRSKLKVIVEQFEFIGPKEEGASQSASGRRETSYDTAPAISQEDIPF